MAVKPKSNFDYEKDEKRGRPRRNAAWAMSNSGNRRSMAAGGDLHTRIEAAYRGKLVGKMIASDTGQFDRETTQLSIKNQIARGKSMRARSEKTFPKDSQSTAEGQRKAYQRDGRLGRAQGNEMTKAKPKYQTAPPPTPPRKGGDNMDKGYKSSNPAKNRQYPGSVGQVGKALEKAYEGGRAAGARMAGAKTTSTKGRIPLVRQVRQNTISPINGRPITPTGGGGTGRGGSRPEFRTGGGGGGEGGIMRKKIR
jgi:hypothetical protein